MRLWHVKLIPYLPRQQLLAQWRECCAIAKNIHDKGTPNHMLVNKVMNYSDAMFNIYAMMIADEMARRGYHVERERFWAWRKTRIMYPTESETEIFPGWHNAAYLVQCYHNLQEKHDCEGISDAEWKKLCKGYDLALATML